MDIGIQSTARTLVVAEFAPGGGAERYVRDLLTFLGRRGETALLLATESPTEATIHVLTSYGHQLEIWRRPRILALLSKNTLLARNPALYFLESLAVRRMVVRKLRFCSRIISTVCSPGRFIFAGPKSCARIYLTHSQFDTWKHRLVGRLFGSGLRGSRLIAISPEIYRSYQKLWLQGVSVPVFLIPNTPGELEVQEKRKARRKLILSVGSLTIEKNPLGSIRAIGTVLVEEEFSEYEYVWCGDGPLADDARDLVSFLGLEGRVKILGQVDQHELEELYQTAKIFIQYSRRDALPYAVLDAIKFGVPFLASDSGGLPYIAGDSKALCVYSLSDEKAMSAGLRKFLRDPVLCDMLTEQQAEALDGEFSLGNWNRSMQQLLEPI